MSSRYKLWYSRAKEDEVLFNVSLSSSVFPSFSLYEHLTLLSSSFCFLLFLSLSLPMSGCPSISLCVCLSLILSLSHTLLIPLYFSLLRFLPPLFSFSLIFLPPFYLSLTSLSFHFSPCLNISFSTGRLTS